MDQVHQTQKMGVTMRQSSVLEFVTEHCQKFGFSPSYQEIGDHLGIVSKSGVKRIIDALVERGHLGILPRKARSLVVIGSDI